MDIRQEAYFARKYKAISCATHDNIINFYESYNAEHGDAINWELYVIDSNLAVLYCERVVKKMGAFIMVKGEPMHPITRLVPLDQVGEYRKMMFGAGHI